MALLALAGGSELGTSLTVRACDVERVLDLKPGARNRESLRALLSDLSGAQLDVTWGNEQIFGTLLPFGHRKDDVYRLDVNPDLIRLASGGFTMVTRGAREGLARKPLAAWLQLHTAWLESQGVRAIELAELHRLSRSTMELRMLRFRTYAALDSLRAVGERTWELHEDDWLRAG